MKRLLAAFFLITVLISNAYSIYATEVESSGLDGNIVDLKFKEHCGELFKTQDRIPNYSYVTYEKNGKEYPVYCLNNDLGGVMEGFEYPVKVTGKIEDEFAWKVIVNGYPYKTPEELGVANRIEAFVATKLAVNMALNEDYADDKYTALDTDESRRVISAYKAILENAKNSDLTMDNDLTSSIVSEKDEWSVDEIDSTCVSKTYRVDTKVKNGEYIIELSSEEDIDGLKVVDENNNPKTSFKLNEKFKLIIPIEKLDKSKNFVIKSNITMQSMPILYGATTIEGMQSYALTGDLEETSKCAIDDNIVKNITRLTIIKKEYNSETTLQGVEFNLLDENRNTIRENLVTNENGEIIIDGIIPGKYYLKEVQTLDNYNLYTDLIEVNISFNEDLKIVVNNTLKEVLEMSNKKEETKQVEPETKIVDQKTETLVSKEINNKEKLPITGY